MGFGENMPLDVLFVRDDDIPDLVQEDVCDLGLVGLNVLEEKRLELAARGVSAAVRDGAHAGFRPLPAVPRGARRLRLSTAPHSLQGKRIATTYPYLLGALPARARHRGRDRDAVGRGGDRAAPGPRGPDLRSGLDRLDAAGQSPARGARPCSRARRC